MPEDGRSHYLNVVAITNWELGGGKCGGSISKTQWRPAIAFNVMGTPWLVRCSSNNRICRSCRGLHSPLNHKVQAQQSASIESPSVQAEPSEFCFKISCKELGFQGDFESQPCRAFPFILFSPALLFFLAQWKRPLLSHSWMLWPLQTEN